MTLSIPLLETERLLLRPVEQTDAPALYDLYTRRGDGSICGLFTPSSPQDSAFWFSLAIDRPTDRPHADMWWAVERKSAPGAIGLCTIHSWDYYWRSALVGYELSTLHQGHGYAREAIEVVLAAGFYSLGLHRIGAQIHPRNAPSLRLIHQLGFSQEGLLRHAAYWQDTHHDLLQFSLLETEFSDSRALPSVPVVRMARGDRPRAVQLLDQ